MNRSLTNRSFGGVRNPNVSVIDVSGRRQGMYAMASGVTQNSLASAQDKLAVLQDDRVALNNIVGAKLGALSANNAKKVAAEQGWQACNSTDCKWNHSASRCNGCRDPFNQIINATVAARPGLGNAINTAKSNLTEKDAEIDLLKETITGLIASIKAENDAEQTLAGQGTSSEVIAVEAEAEAEAMVNTARAEAESKAADSAVSTSGKKTRNMIIALVALSALTIGVIFMVRKIRKKKRGTK